MFRFSPGFNHYHTLLTRAHICVLILRTVRAHARLYKQGGVDLNIYISYKYRMRLSSINKMSFQKKTKSTFVKFLYRVAIKIIGSAIELASLARAWQHSIDIHLSADTAKLSCLFFKIHLVLGKVSNMEMLWFSWFHPWVKYYSTFLGLFTQ